MSIQTTQTLTKQKAVDRISNIACITYSSLHHPFLKECFSNEDKDLDIEKTYNRFLTLFLKHIDNMNLPLNDTIYNNVEDMKNIVEMLPNKLLEDFMDLQGVRFNMFENYIIEN